MTGKRKRTLILSDVHLSQTHPDDPSDPLWMRYRRAEFHPDADFEALVDHVLARLDGAGFELVFNGDVLDFDAPWVKDGESSFDEYPLDDAGCAEHARRILVDHPRWFRAVARVLLAGHRVLFLSGNHDLELYWPGVRRAIRDHILELCRTDARGVAGELPLAELAATFDDRLRFRAWFHVTEDRLYIEHGSQYDIFNGVPYAMVPITPAGDSIHPAMGKLAFKRTGSRMGYFNPYYEETFYMGFSGYFMHFARFYATGRRHIARTWFFGAVRTALACWRGRHDEDWRERNHDRAAAETGASREAIEATFALRADFAERTMLPILRELWLDRLIVLVLVATIVGGAALAFGLHGALVAGGVVAVAVALYEIFMPKPDIRTYDSAPPEVLRLLDIHGARALCFGHTHRPFGRWDEQGRLHGNSGSWCPAFFDQECTRPVLERRPVLLVTTEGPALEGGVHWWKGGELCPDETGARPGPVRADPKPAPAASERSEAREHVDAAPERSEAREHADGPPRRLSASADPPAP